MEFLPPPEVLGLPQKYTAWRRNQAEAISRALENEKRVTISICPTGFGKSLMYVAASKLVGGKTIILTSTKGLQSQLMRDFEEVGMVDVRGKNSYKCPISHNELTCDVADCSVGIPCNLRGTDRCPYYAAIIAARKASLIVTNYPFWFYSNQYGEGIGMPNLLVCDEGHDAPEAVAAFLTVDINRSDKFWLATLPVYPEGYTIPAWIKWAEHYGSMMRRAETEALEAVRNDPSRYNFRELAKVRKLLGIFNTLADMDPDNWVCDVQATTISFSPIRVSDKCQEILFKTAKRVILTSASICAKTGEMLGLDPDNYMVTEYPHTFPLETRLIYHIQGARMNATTSPTEVREWLKTIDRIIEGRLDRKGIIHTTAYHRRDFIMAHSKYNYLMMSHETKDVVQMVNKFKESSPPKVFVSPSVTTGWDFPYQFCEFQIIGKVPYPDSRNKITKARMNADEDYAPYVAMQQLVQTCGRGNRAEDDQCENFIIDDNITWFAKYNRRFAPKWFLESLTSRIFPPQAPPKLERR
jgi:Rad3-related DNA helicase